MTLVALWCADCASFVGEIGTIHALPPGREQDHLPVGLYAKSRLGNDQWEFTLRKIGENYAWVALCAKCIAKEQAFTLSRPQVGYCWDDPASSNMSANWMNSSSVTMCGAEVHFRMRIGENLERHAKNSHPCVDCHQSPACRECERVLHTKGNAP